MVQQTNSVSSSFLSGFAFCILHFAFLISGFSQVTLQGTVLDKNTGKPLSGANLLIENTFLSAISDEKGKYIINIHKQKTRNQKPETCQVKISFMGYKTIQAEVQLSGDSVIDFLMVPSPILGEEVNIIATRAQQWTPVTFTSMTNKEIATVNSGQDMPYILQSTPSVVVTSDAGNGIGYTGINIRGTDMTRINVTLNGIPLNDAESQGVWFVDLPDLASSTQNIQVQRGVGTSTNGPGAFGATINIQTLNTGNNPYAELNCSGGSFNTLKTTFLFGTGMMKDKFAFDGRASYITSGGYIDRADAKLKSFYLSGGYFGKTTTIKFNLLSGWEKTYQAWEGVPKDSLLTNRTYNPSGEYIDQDGRITYYKNQTDNYNQSHYQLLFSQKAGDGINVNAALFFTKGQGYYENYEPGQSLQSYGLNNVVIGSDTITNSDMVTRKWLDNDFYGLTFSGNYNSTDKLKIILGGAWSHYLGKHYGKIEWAQFASNGNNERNWYDNYGKKSDFNIYIKFNYQVLQKLNLFGDFQYRKVDYTLDGDLESLTPVNQIHHFNFYNPKAGLSFDLNSNQHLYFSFATGNREPNRNNYEVADSSNMPSPERLYDYELGYDLRFTKFSAGACLYYMDYYDQLVLTGKINSVGEAIMVNVPHSFRSGIEITAGADIFKWLKWHLNSTFSINKIKNFTEYVDNYDSSWSFTGQTQNQLGTTDISFSPGIIATNTFTFIPILNFNITLNSKYIGRQYIDNTSSKARSLDPYFINGISIGYNLSTKVIKNIVFTLSINNLFSSRYESNAWVYRYNYNGEPYESNGYFPQALINFLVGVSIKI